MLFTSVTFIAFAAVLLLLYYALPKRLQPALLFLFSAAFLISYDVKNLAFIAFTVITTWGAGLLMSRQHRDCDAYIEEHKADLSREEKKARRTLTKRRVRLLMAAAMVLNFGVLAVIKYQSLINLAVGGIFRLEEGDMFLSIALPLGISFYTFMCMGYLVDVCRGKYEADRNILHIALFASYFPSLVQGPFSRYDDLGQTLFTTHKFDKNAFSSAVLRIAWGYFKKLVLADRVSIVLMELFGRPDEFRGAYVFAALVLYSLRIYADFTGGIDITMGLSEALGIKLRENFILPYFSKSIAEYWRRWHITLGEWFREYIFYPLSISKPINKLSKNLKPKVGANIAKRLPVWCATIITWFVTGIWHGSTWNFIAWGMANCFVILISQELTPLYEKFHKKTGIGDTGAYGAFMILRTYFLMGMIRMFDCYATVGITLAAVGSMFTTWNPQVLFDGSLLTLGLTAADYIVLALGSLLIFVVSLMNAKKSVRERLAARPWLRFAATMALIFLVLVFGAYGLGYDSSAFIYNQF